MKWRWLVLSLKFQPALKFRVDWKNYLAQGHDVQTECSEVHVTEGKRFSHLAWLGQWVFYHATLICENFLSECDYLANILVLLLHDCYINVVRKGFSYQPKL